MFAFDILYPMFLKPRTILFEIHLVLTPGREDEKLFEKGPILGLIRAKSLKGILVRAQVTPLKKKRGCCKSCKGKSVENANLWLLELLDLSLLKENTALNPHLLELQSQL